MAGRESAQLRYVAELAAAHGVLLHHCRDARQCTGTPGLPDLILLGPRGLAFRELKSAGYRSPAQTDWHWGLKAAGADVGLWYPGHERDGTIEREILALSRA